MLLVFLLAATTVVAEAPSARAEPDVEITTTSPLPGGTVGTAYSTTLQASGGTPPYSWSVISGSLPGGLSLASSGLISGTPSSAGEFTFTVRVEDEGEPPELDAKQFTVTIAPPPLVITTTSPLSGGTVGTAYSTTLQASGGTPPYSWSVISGSLPGGLSLASSGLISGTPSTAGTFTFTARVADSGVQFATRQFTVTIAPPLLVITTTSPLSGGTVGTAYSTTLQASGGTPPYSWSVISGSLPGGLSLASGGLISGTPSTAGTFTFTARVADSGVQFTTRQFTVNINAVPVLGPVTIRNHLGTPTQEFTVGAPVRLVGTFDDPNPQDVHTVIVDWGDGTTTETVLDPVGTRQFEVSHPYTALGVFFIELTVGDGTGSSDPWPGIVVVGGVLGPSGPTGVGLVDPVQGRWHLRGSGDAVTSFFYGNPGDVPFMGDWNCDGIDTPGLYRQSDGFVYLRNSNSQGVADIRFFFGNPGDVPIAGDFNGNGCDTVSIYRPSEGRFYIINELGANDGGLGAADFSYFFGNLGDKPFVGDFTGDGIATVGLHRESTGLVYFRNTHTQGSADHQFIFGNPGDRLVAGDWNGDSLASPGIFRPGDATFYLRFTNTQGPADMQFAFGSGDWLPVAGNLGLP